MEAFYLCDASLCVFFCVWFREFFITERANGFIPHFFFNFPLIQFLDSCRKHFVLVEFAEFTRPMEIKVVALVMQKISLTLNAILGDSWILEDITTQQKCFVTAEMITTPY